MTTRIAVVIDTNGNRCGDKCCVSVGPRGAARCEMFSAPLERPCIGSPHEMVPKYEAPIRCGACLRAEKRLCRELTKARVEGRLAAMAERLGYRCQDSVYNAEKKGPADLPERTRDRYLTFAATQVTKGAPHATRILQ